jgi:hypothetical protein
MATAKRTLKVFVTGAGQQNLGASTETIERYPGFLLVAASPDAVSAMAGRYPVEDITDQYRIVVGDTTLDPDSLQAPPKVRGVAASKAAGKHHHLVQFVGPIKRTWLPAVRKAGGEPREPRSGFAYVVRADAAALARISALPFVRWVGPLPHEERIAPNLRGDGESGSARRPLPRRRTLAAAYAISFFGPEDAKKAVPALKKLGFKMLSQNPRAKLLVVQSSDKPAKAAQQIQAASAVHGVRFVRERVIKRSSNDVAAPMLYTEVNAGGNPGGLTGSGEVVAVCDTGIDSGDPTTIHPDFRGRVKAVKSYPMTDDFDGYVQNPRGNDGPADLASGHGTHVAGSVLGDGTASAAVPGLNTRIRGVAHKAKLVFQAVEQEMKWKDPKEFQRSGRFILAGIPHDLGPLFQDAWNKGARVHSNSWGGGDPGAYDIQCEQLDRFVWKHPTFIVVVAAGNDGTDADGDGRINPLSVTSPGTAKNCITVGASENLRPQFNSQQYGEWWPRDYPALPYRTAPMADNPGQVVAFSSRGPTADGRLKPEVIAPGTFILSTRSTRLPDSATGWAPFAKSRMYFHMGGTSMAAPLTAGAVAALREYFRKRRKVPSPSAALLKAALIVGALRLPDGPAQELFDNAQGYGRVSLDRIVAPAAPATFAFADIKKGLHTGEVHTQTLAIKSSAAPLRIAIAYSDFPGPALVNNLNLILTAPDGHRYTGNGPVGGTLVMDSKNNTEVIEVKTPAPGAWKVEVIASSVPEGPQPFALAYLAHV